MFWDVKTKGYNSGRVYTKLLILYNKELSDLLEMIKEDMSESKMYVKAQAVLYFLIETTGWYIKLYLDIDIESMKGFLIEK